MFWDRFVLQCNKINKSPNGVCADLGLSVATATRWKQGSIPRDTTMKKIADYFGTSVSYLSGLTDDPDPLTFIFPIEKDSPLLGKMRIAMQSDADDTRSDVDAAMDKLTASLQEAMDAIEARKSPSILDRLGDVVKQLSKDDLEELGRYAEYLASKKNN